MKLTIKMQNTVRDSQVGEFLSRLIENEFASGGDTNHGGRGNVIQSLWEQFMIGAGLPCDIEYEDDPVGFDKPSPKIDELVARRRKNLERVKVR